MLIIENMIWRSSRSEDCIGVRVTQHGSRHQTINLNNSECKHLIYTRIYLKKWFSMCDIGYALIFGLASHQSYETGTSRTWLWAVDCLRIWNFEFKKLAIAFSYPKSWFRRDMISIFARDWVSDLRYSVRECL